MHKIYDNNIMSYFLTFQIILAENAEHFMILRHPNGPC